MARGRGRKPIPRNQSLKQPIVDDSSSDSSSDSSIQVTPKTPLDLGELIEHFIPSKDVSVAQAGKEAYSPVIPASGAIGRESGFKVGSIDIASSSKGKENVGVNENEGGPSGVSGFKSRLVDSKAFKGMDLNYVDSDSEMVDLEIDDVKDDLLYWEKTLVGCFIGSRTNFAKIQDFIKKSWNHIAKPRVLHLKKNWYYFLFESIEDRDSILRGGPWFLEDCSLILKKWHTKIFQEIEDITVVPIWVTFPYLDPMLWTQKALSKIASKIGKPLFADPITSSKERISFARVMIEVDIAQPLKTSIDIKSPFGGIHSQSVSYEWVPYFCHSCKKLGHDLNHCKEKRKVFVPKNREDEAIKPGANLIDEESFPVSISVVSDEGTVEPANTDKREVGFCENSADVDISAPHRKLSEEAAQNSSAEGMICGTDQQISPVHSSIDQLPTVQPTLICAVADSGDQIKSLGAPAKLDGPSVSSTSTYNKFEALSVAMMEGGRAPHDKT